VIVQVICNRDVQETNRDVQETNPGLPYLVLFKDKGRHYRSLKNKDEDMVAIARYVPSTRTLLNSYPLVRITGARGNMASLDGEKFS
jgi:hypothetical protein